MSIDLHCHTLFSVDSYGTPEALIDAADDAGLTADPIADITKTRRSRMWANRPWANP